jgi:hypothetical protein
MRTFPRAKSLPRPTPAAGRENLFQRVYSQIEAEQLEVRRPVAGRALARAINKALQALDEPTPSQLLIAVRMQRGEFVPEPAQTLEGCLAMPQRSKVPS